MKKFKMIVVALVVALLVPSAAFASSMETLGSGEWDYIGYDYFRTQSKNFYSGGGDFMICLDSSSPKGNYYLFEEDPYARDDKVAGVYFNGGSGDNFYKVGNLPHCHIFRDIGGFVDGTNDRAEFYVSRSTDTGEALVGAYD